MRGYALTYGQCPRGSRFGSLTRGLAPCAAWSDDQAATPGQRTDLRTFKTGFEMAVYRCEIKRVSRSSGRSAVAASAYRAAQRLRDDRQDKQHDYRRRAPGVAYREVMAGPDAPAWARERGRLWNAAEQAERRKDATTAREAILSLPHELDDVQRIELVRGFSQRLIDRYGVAVDMAIHRPDRKGDERNHHAHLLFTTRRMGREGLQEKTRELDDRKTGPQEIEAIRQMWEQEQNRALEIAGKLERVSCRSNEAQGIERTPQPKMGEKFTALSRQGIKPRAVDNWQEVARRHALTKEENRAQLDKRHPLEKEATARKYARDHSPMRQNMARQRSGKLEQQKKEAIERALHAARQHTANENGPVHIADALMRDTSEVQRGQQEAEQMKKDEARKLDEERAKAGGRSALRAWEKARQDELRRQQEERDRQMYNENDPGRLMEPPGPR